MIHWVRILHDSGLCLHTCNFSNQDINPEKHDGFVLALLILAKELQQKTIKEVQMEGKCFLFAKRDPIIIMASTTEEVDKKKLSQTLNDLLEDFFNQYSEIIEHEEYNAGSFSSFSKTIEEEFERNGIPSSLC